MIRSKRGSSRLCRLALHPPHSTVRPNDVAGTTGPTIEFSTLAPRHISTTRDSYVEAKVACRELSSSRDTAFHSRRPWKRSGSSILRVSLGTFASAGRQTHFEGHARVHNGSVSANPQWVEIGISAKGGKRTSGVSFILRWGHVVSCWLLVSHLHCSAARRKGARFQKSGFLQHRLSRHEGWRFTKT